MSLKGLVFLERKTVKDITNYLIDKASKGISTTKSVPQFIPMLLSIPEPSRQYYKLTNC